MTSTILLVDDEPDLEALVQQKFRRQIRDGEVRFLFARDGVEALDYLFATGVHAERDPKALPAVILLDLKLPKVNKRFKS